MRCRIASKKVSAGDTVMSENGQSSREKGKMKGLGGRVFLSLPVCHMRLSFWGGMACNGWGCRSGRSSKKSSGSLHSVQRISSGHLSWGVVGGGTATACYATALRGGSASINLHSGRE